MNISELIQNQPLLMALIAGVIISITCAILGVFITIRRESLFSDGLAHASLAGVAVALMFSLEPFYIAFIVAVFVAIAMVYIKRNSVIYSDAIIGILFTVLFSLGLIIMSLSGKADVELEVYLFGEIEAVTVVDLIFAGAATILTIIATVALYKKFLFISIDPEGAYIRGIKVGLMEYIIAILTTVAIIISIKLVGVLLATALLIIPATNAKLLAGKFSQMIPISIAHNIITVILGIMIAKDTPPGATIVVISGALLFVTFALQKVRNLF